MGEPIAVPCPWCGREGYDRVYMDERGVSRHDFCGKPVEYTIHNRIRWWWHRHFGTPR